MRFWHDSTSRHSRIRPALEASLSGLVVVMAAGYAAADAPEAARDSLTATPTDIEIHRTLDGRYVATETAVRAARPDAQQRGDLGSSSLTVIEVGALDGSYHSVADLLRSTAGLSVRESGGVLGYASLSLRGSSAAQVPVFLDGVPLASPAEGGVDLGSLPLQSIASIEVYRGSAPLVLGEASLGGAVHLRTHSGQHPRRIAITQGSFGHREVNASASVGLGDWILDLRGRALRNRGDWSFHDDRGTLYNLEDDATERRLNNDVRGGGLLVHALRPGLAGSLRAQLLVDLREQGTPGYSVRQSRRARSASKTAQSRLAWLAATGRSWWREVSVFAREELQDFSDPDGDFSGRVIDREDRLQRAGVRVLGHWRRTAHRAFSLEAGWARLRSRDHASPTLGSGHQTRWHLAAALEPRLDWRRWRLEPGVRVERSGDRVDGRVLQSSLDRDDVEGLRRWSTTWRAGLRWQTSPSLALRANLAHSQRVPTLLERFGDRGTVTGNPRLQPESGEQRDLGLVWRPAPGRRFAVNLFDNHASDLIAYEANSPVSTQAVNIGRAEIRGVEVEADFGRYGPFDTRLSLTRMRSTDRSSRLYARGSPLPGRPGLVFQVLQGWRVASARVETTLRAMSGNYLQTGGREATPSRLLVDLQGQLPLANKLSMVVRVENLGGVEAYDLWNFPLPGREVAVALRWNHDGLPR